MTRDRKMERAVLRDRRMTDKSRGRSARAKTTTRRAERRLKGTTR